MNAQELFFFYLILNIFKIVKTMDTIKFKGDFQIGNFAKTAEGHVLVKNESLLSTTLTPSEEQCMFECVKHPACLSVNVIALNASSHQCEMFNWTAKNVNGFLLPKRNAYHATLQGVCLNGGTCEEIISGTCQCACPAGFNGSSCEIGPYQDCSALQSAGFQSSGIYEVDPDGKGRFLVYCDMVSEGGGWTVIHNRSVDGSVSFNHNWNEYKAGFGDMKNGEFWLGNDNIHRLTAARPATKLFIPLEDTNGLKFYAKYSTFSVASESDLYRLKVFGYTGTAGDSLDHSNPSWKSNGMAFSTPVRDNDLFWGNCAGLKSAGWWFNYCAAGSLNARSMQWHSLSNINMKKASMKIKPSA